MGVAISSIQAACVCLLPAFPTFRMFPVRASCALVAFIAIASAKPTIHVEPYMNLGAPIQVTYNATDGYDGRKGQCTTPPCKSTSTTGNDWIGLFRSGECLTSSNLQDRHKCHIATRTIPKTEWSGGVTFEVSEYLQAGDYDVRYFFGDDPNIEGGMSPHFEWAGNGYVCKTNAGIEGSIMFLNEIDYEWVQYVSSQANWTQSDFATPYSPTTTCDCVPEDEPTFLTKRRCCLRHQNCVPRIERHIAVCNQYHETYLADNDITTSCQCNPTTGTAEDQAWCKETQAACLRCALDSVASASFSILGTMGVDTPQPAVNTQIPGFERIL